MRIGVVQTNSVADPSANLDSLERYFAELRDTGAQLVVLPENVAAFCKHPAQRREIAETDGNGPIQDRLAELARRFQFWVIAGTIPISSSDPERPYASCCVYDANGERVSRYDKIHLFDVDVPGSDESYRESEFTAPGNSPIVVTTPFAKVGLAVCYDLRFPEHFRRLISSGMDLLALPAAFTFTTGKAHWESLLRARAIENQCFVAAAAQTGTHADGRTTWGHSMLVDGWGRILRDLGTNPGVACVSIDLGALKKLREDFPVLTHQRANLFAAGD